MANRHTHTHTHTPGLKFLGAERVTNVLNGVTETVGVVIGWVDTPPVPGMGVGGVLDSVGHRILFAVLHGQLHPDSGLGNGRREEENCSRNAVYTSSPSYHNNLMVSGFIPKCKYNCQTKHRLGICMWSGVD